MEAEKTQFDQQSYEALRTLGKTLSQLSLYKVGHPAVAAMLATAVELLQKAMSQTPTGELSFSIDQDKLIAGGRIVGQVSGLPSSVQAAFTRFKLASLTFKSGLTQPELAAFCELAASRPDAQAAADPNASLAQKGVSHIVFSEALYAKMDDAALMAVLDQKSVEDTIRALVGNALSDPNQHKQVYAKVMALLQEDIQKRVEEVVKPLREERNVLANESARTTSVIQNMVEGVVVVDDQGKVLMMNPAAEEIYGTTLAEAAGQPLTHKAKEEHMITLASELQTPPDREIKKDVAVAGVDDTKRTLKSSSAVVQNEAGKVVGMVSTLSDKTKQKEYQKMEREFVAHVTHELRAPLTSIRAALDILQEEFHGHIKEEEARMLTNAIANSERLEKLINDILDFGKIESGQMTVTLLPSDPAKIVQEAIDSMKPWSLKKGLNLVSTVEPSLPQILADHRRTVQIFINLLSNALKFTPRNGTISLKAVSAGAPGDKVVEFSVTDTGPGIPKAEQKRIFEKFVQIASGEMHVGGTGLGLAIAKALVFMMGGKMWVESEPDKGASFLFTIPVYAAPKEGAPAAPPPAKPWWKELLGLN